MPLSASESLSPIKALLAVRSGLFVGAGGALHDAGGAMLLTMVFFGGWLSRFKLIRRRRISLATFAAFGGAHNQ